MLSKRLTAIYHKIEKFILAWSIIAITCVMIFNVFARYLFNRSWTPTEEICLTLVIFSTFLGAGYATRKGEHLFVSVIYDLQFFSVYTKRSLLLILSLVSCVVCIFGFVYGSSYVYANYLNNRVTPALGIPMYIVYIAIPAGFVLMAVHYWRNVLRNIRNRKNYSLGPDEGRSDK